METVIGIKGKNFVVLAADCSSLYSVISYKRDDDKLFPLNDKCIVGGCGDRGDLTMFVDYVAKNIALFNIRDEYNKSTHSIAHFIRKELATAIRKNPKEINLVLGGIDDDKPSLYYLDYLGTLQDVNYCMHGICDLFIQSIIQDKWTEEISVEDTLKLLQECIVEINKRTAIHQPNFKIKIITKDGIKIIA